MVCAKVVCERGRVTKLWERWCVCLCVCVTNWCVKDGLAKDGVWQSCVKDGVVKDGVRQSCVWKMVWWKMVCDKVVCERWCGERWCETKCCVKDGVWKMVCDGVWEMICPTPATQNDSRCEFVPRLPRETKVDVRLCHACHAKCRGVTGAQSRPKGATQYHKCHACHVKRRWISGCATPTTQSGAASQAPNPGPRAPPSTICVTPATQNDGRCEFMCHACHVKRRWISGCATPATQSDAASQAPNPGPRAPPSTISATAATQNDGRCEFVPRLPRETKVDLRLCHACHAKWQNVCW